MPVNKVTFYLQTADRTRKAQVTVPRSMRVRDIVRASAHRWFISMRIDYQVANTTTGSVLLSNETLAPDRVHDGDVLMIQPFPTHGCGGVSRLLPLRKSALACRVAAETEHATHLFEK